MNGRPQLSWFIGLVYTRRLRRIACLLSIVQDTNSDFFPPLLQVLELIFDYFVSLLVAGLIISIYYLLNFFFFSPYAVDE